MVSAGLSTYYFPDSFEKVGKINYLLLPTIMLSTSNFVTTNPGVEKLLN